MSYLPGVWVRRDGRHVKIAKMETEHLVNAIRMLERNKLFDETFLDLVRELMRRDRISHILVSMRH